MLPTPLHRFISFAIAGSIASALAAANYTPEKSFRLDEKWRWHELEILSDYAVDRGVEDESGNLVFTEDESLIVYDGYSIRKIAYPVDDEAFESYDIFRSQNGAIYLNSTHGVFSLRNEEWELLSDDGILTPITRTTFASNGLGLEVLATPGGIFRIEASGITPIPELAYFFNGIGFDSKNRFWGVRADNQQAVVLQFEGNEVRQPIDLISQTISPRANAFPDIIADPSSDEVWSTNWLAVEPAARYDDESSAWIAHDLIHLAGNNRHTYGFRIDADNMAVFSKTAVLVKHLEDWHAIEYPEFDFPSNHPFLIKRANGNIVIGGRGEKVFEIDYNSDRKDSYTGLHFQCDVRDGTRWFLSIDGHIIEHDSVYDTWTRHDSNVIDTPVSVLRSADDTIWAAGSHNGVAAVSYYNGRDWQRDLFPELNSFISHHSCRVMPNGDIVFGSGEDDPVKPNGGLIVYRKTNNGYQYAYVGPPVVPPRPVGIAPVGENDLWFGGRQLARTDIDLIQPFTTENHFTDDRWIDDVSEDNQGNLWVAIWERGLFKLKGNDWEQMTESATVVSNQICYILKDTFRTDSLWFATDRGISRFDGDRWFPQAMPAELSFAREGGNLRQSSDGAIWVNVATRDWFFRKTPQFYLTKRMRDRFQTVRYALDDSPPVVTVPTVVPQSTAPANLLIQWQGVDKWSVTPRNQLKYSFRLNEDPWSEFEEGESHVFLDLPAGDYRFDVRALDRDGNISAIASSSPFAVVPPVWQRLWFITLMVLLVITIIGLAGMLVRQRIRHVMQMDEFKLQFFTNISHELRTPLTVILGPLESQLAKLPASWDRKPLEIAYQNARKTLRLIDQLLDFRSAETDSIKINLARSDLVVTARETIALLKPLADERSQRIEFVSSTPSCVAMFDAEVIDKVLNNLISNAIKYTQPGGLIIVRLDTIDESDSIRVHFVVEDNGSGIPAENLNSIFEVFVRARTRSQKGIRGSGIGLAFVKKLVEHCEGLIEVESPITTVNGNRQGTRFSVTLPLEKATPLPVVEAPSETVDTPTSPDPNNEEDFESEDPRPHILVVEDDEEIRAFLTSELQETYRVTNAKDGAEALTLSTSQIPDLIITDIMMPVVDGKELCRQVKANEATSHIPIIMLTALKSEQHELEGLELGAEDYLSKPIHLSILKRRIHNLLESRQKLQIRFQSQKGEASIAPKEVTSNPIDEAFLNKAVTTVEECLEDPLFDVEAFALKMFMSRMTLYRKLKALTGDSPSAFIRSIRMNKAAALLATREHNVSETADLVGIPDLSSFSTAFKKHFDVTPSQYTRRND
ncbi:MAG: hypothetical protein SynsKO_21520 [Synoicihabitans sp.]